MTTAKLVSSPPQGSGLVPSVVDGDYEDLVRGRPGRLIAARILMQAVGTSQRRTKEGVHRTVTYELVRLEPVRDKHEADNVTWEISHEYEGRTSRGSHSQPSLFNSPAEQRESLVEAIREWASDNDRPMAEVDAQFLDHFGGPEHQAAATIQAGSLIHLMEFARFVGAVEDPKPGDDQEPAVDPDTEADPDDDDEDLATDEDPAAEAKPASNVTPVDFSGTPDASG